MDHPRQPDTAVGDPKQQVRRRIRARRRARAADEDLTAREDVSDALAFHVIPLLDGLPAGAAVAVYRALLNEPPTHGLLVALHERGLRVLVPELLPDKDLEWRPLRADGSEGERLGRDAIGDAELVLVPALAVDRRGHRLGQGGGSYDRALTRRGAGAHVVAVVFDDEVVEEELPAQAHDERVDSCLTPGRGWFALPSQPPN